MDFHARPDALRHLAAITALSTLLCSPTGFAVSPGPMSGQLRVEATTTRGQPLPVPPRIAGDLLARLRRGGQDGEQARVIVQLQGDAASALRSLSRRYPLAVHRVLSGIDAAAVTLPVELVPDLSLEPQVKWISPDRSVRSASASSDVPPPPVPVMSAESELELGHLAVTTGASQVMASPENPMGRDGDGIGVAVLDSGSFNPACAFRTLQDGTQQSRVLYWEDFTGESLTDADLQAGADFYGHGTHVSSVLAGDGCGSAAGEDWGGIARGANLVVMRVLDSEGTGSASDVIAAVDRAIEQKDAFNIRVMNLSLGTTPAESYRTDPLCQAVERAVDAGIVVVVAAGNYGEDENGESVYGGILSPAIDPMVVTVGAVDTKTTDARSDDDIAGFSSRGPTMGCTTDTDALEACDLLLKPDLVAPGVYIEGVVYPDNYLYTTYSQTHIEDSRRYFYLHGTSIAAPVVAGAVVLMLEENSTLSPNLVKAILQYSAVPLPGLGILDQGAGALNVAGAVQMAWALRHDLDDVAVGEPIVYEGGELPEAETEISSEAWSWSTSFFWEWRAISGDEPFRTMVEPWQDSGAYAWGGDITYAEMEAAQELEGESLVWAGSFVWADSFVWAGTVMDLTAYAANASATSDDPLAVNEDSSSSATSFIWGSSVITEATLTTPNSALIDGMGITWNKPI